MGYYWHNKIYNLHFILKERGIPHLFFNAFNARFGIDPKLRSRVAREKRSKIRSYYCYTPNIVENLINAGAI